MLKENVFILFIQEYVQRKLINVQMPCQFHNSNTIDELQRLHFYSSKAASILLMKSKGKGNYNTIDELQSLRQFKGFIDEAFEFKDLN